MKLIPHLREWATLKLRHPCMFAAPTLITSVLFPTSVTPAPWFLLTQTVIKGKINRDTELHFPLRIDFKMHPFHIGVTFGMSEHPTIFQQQHYCLFYSLLEVLLLHFQSLKFTLQTQPITMLKVTASIWLHLTFCTLSHSLLGAHSTSHLMNTHTSLSPTSSSRRQKNLKAELLPICLPTACPQWTLLLLYSSAYSTE